MSSQENYKHILEEIGKAALRVGRNPKDVKLICVTKNVAWQDIQPIYDLGQRNFGESRLQEAFEKQTAAPEDCLWHFIGTLQKNKVRKVIENFVLIHSIDSYELALKISHCSQELGLTTQVLLEANTSGESTKHGLTPNEWKEYFEKLLALPSISIKGLMTMASYTDDDNLIRNSFAALRELRDDLREIAGGKIDLSELSMGMSHDFKIAIEEGATLVRIGSAIFNA